MADPKDVKDMFMSSTASVSVPRRSDLATPIPRTLKELDAQRRVAPKLTLNDYVEKYHRELLEDQEYQDLLDAVYDEDAKEGSLVADTHEAARMIRDLAGKAKDEYVSHKKLATLMKALGVVLRRYGMSRQERRNTIGGEPVSGNGSRDE